MTKQASLFYSVALISLTILISCNNSDNSKLTTDIIGNQVVDMEIIKNEIDEANREYVGFFNAGDSKGLANMFTVDAKSLEPNQPSFIGRNKIENNFANIMNDGAIKLEVTTLGLWGDEKMLAEEGIYIFLGKDENVLDKGKYITLWKKENSEWKLFRDCVNSDLPVESSK